MLKLKRGRPKSVATKEHDNVRFDTVVLERFMASGPGWQARMNTALTAPSLPHSTRCCQLLSVGCATRNLMLNKSVPFFPGEGRPG